jgi:hypothetical protein
LKIQIFNFIKRKVAYLPRQKSVANKSQTKKVNVKELTCLTCGETKKIQDFYTSSSVFHAGTQRVPYCKLLKRYVY